MLDKDFKTVGNSPLFRAMTVSEIESALERFSATAEETTHGSFLLRVGEPCRHFGIVLEGTIEVFMEDLKGQHIIMATVSKGGIFGEALNYLSRSESPIYIIAKTDARVLWLKTDLFQEHNYDRFTAELHRRFSALLSEKLLEMNDRVQILSKPSIREKVLTYFTLLCRRSASNQFDIPFNRESFADYLGVNRSALSRTLAQLRDEGVLSFSKNHFELFIK